MKVNFFLMDQSIYNNSKESHQSKEDFKRRVFYAEASYSEDEIQAGILAQVEQTETSINAVNGVISRIDEFATSISAATEEQSATSSEVAARIAETAQSVRMVSELIQNVTNQASENDTKTVHLLQTTADLETRFKDLEDRAHEFSNKVRGE